MPGIPREVIEHQLKVYPVSQKPRRQSVEQQDFIRQEVRKLLHASFIEEVHHPVWLPTQSSCRRPTGSFGCASTKPT
jgi:hypothetical protein